MNPEVEVRNEPQEPGRNDPPDVVKRLVARGEMEVVKTASGTVLYITQALDE